jgi:hypothetical protein
MKLFIAVLTMFVLIGTFIVTNNNINNGNGQSISAGCGRTSLYSCRRCSVYPTGICK